MKKLLGLLLAAVIAFPASAAVIKNVELTGEIQTIASDTHHALPNEGKEFKYSRGAKTRAIAGLSFNVVEDVKANVLFQYAYDWGDHNYTNNGFDNGKGMYLANANLVFSNLFGSLEATIGRQFYGDENSAVMYFGPNHYNAEGLNYARALDAAKLVYSNDTWTATIIGGKIANWTVDNMNVNKYDDYEVAMFGADVKANLTDALTAQVYGYDFQGKKEKLYYGYQWYGEDTHQGFYGAKISFAPEAFRMSAEYARDMAGSRVFKEHADTGYMVKADVATDIEAVTVRGTFLYSKHFWNAYGNYVPGLLMQPFFTSNNDTMQNVYNYSWLEGTRMFNVGMDFRPADQWTVSLDAYSFQRRSASHTATYEFDAIVKYDYNNNVQLFAGIGYAKYGHDDTSDRQYGITYTTDFSKDNTKGQLGMLVRF